MDGYLRNYLVSLFIRVPDWVFEGMLSMLCIGTVLMIIIKGKKARHFISLLILIEYILLIFCSTVIFRVNKDLREYDFTPFWSYNKADMLFENILNVVAFIPVGLLLGGAFRRVNWSKTLMFGFGFSLTIELLQFIFKKGFAEIDDMIHNSLGCMIGYGIYSLCRYGYEKVCKRSVAVL